MNDSVFTKNLAVIFFILLSILGTGILHHYKEDFHLSNFSMKKRTKDNRYSGHLKCNIVSSVGRGNILKIEMAIPCENEEQQADLKRKMKIIKNDFFVSVDQAQMESWARQGDFNVIKNTFLKIVNQHTNSPVETVYFVSVLSF